MPTQKPSPHPAPPGATWRFSRPQPALPARPRPAPAPSSCCSAAAAGTAGVGAGAATAAAAGGRAGGSFRRTRPQESRAGMACSAVKSMRGPNDLRSRRSQRRSSSSSVQQQQKRQGGCRVGEVLMRAYACI